VLQGPGRELIAKQIPFASALACVTRYELALVLGADEMTEANTNNPAVESSQTIREWCAVERMSLAMFHSLGRRGLGPDTIKIGSFVRVIETHSAWRARMVERSKEEAGRREDERRREQASRAGKAAAASPRHVFRRRQRDGGRGRR
jgi:hypothetical protein